MARSSVILVQAVVPHIETTVNLAPFLEQASRMIKREIEAERLITDEEQLTDIETYLAGHLASVAYPPNASENGTGVGATAYRRSAGTGLQSTPCGQMLLSLDTTGTLAYLFCGKRVDVSTVGTL